MIPTSNPARPASRTIGDVPIPMPAADEAASKLKREAPAIATLEHLANNAPFLAADNLVAGYGSMEIIHGVSLRVAKGQALCLIGPNGAGKSTVLHTIYGFTDLSHGTVLID